MERNKEQKRFGGSALDMVTELPVIKWKGKKYIYDSRLSELRTTGKKVPWKSINLNAQENELLEFALGTKDKKLIRVNMEDLDWKLKEVI